MSNTNNPDNPISIITNNRTQFFPSNFTWGVATSAYQIEGASSEDDKSPSIWDAFCQVPGAIADASSGHIACDHYHRYKEDIQLMKQIGLQSYRFSISWCRVFPDGYGRVNPAGLAFYDKLVDALLEADITPFITLYHWDLPLSLHHQGGWLNPSSPGWFADFTATLVQSLSDRVKFWMTFNEPQCFIGWGYREGIHAPGLRLPWQETLQAAHNVLLAHGKGVQAARSVSKQSLSMGIAMVGSPAIPASTRIDDIQAAKKAMFAVNGQDFWNNSWFGDPIFLKHYPQDGLDIYQNVMPTISQDDFDVIGQPLDFLGVNIYRGSVVQATQKDDYQIVDLPSGHARNTMGWAITPEAMYWGPKFLSERYNVPLYITENGIANTDWIARDGKVHDPQRIDFTAAYLDALRRASTEGVDIRGYFHWSLMDNFEWAEGYNPRLGLIYVDYSNQKRLLKDSADWYARVISSNGSVLDFEEDA